MPNQMYKFNGTISSMTDEGLLNAVLEAEVRLRGGDFKYVDVGVSPQQFATWPEDAKHFARAEGKRITASRGAVPKDELLRESIAATLTRLVAHNRAVDKVMLQSEIKTAAADLAISTLFRMAPSADPVWSPRVYAPKIPAIQPKCSTKVGKMVVNCDEIEAAEIYMAALYYEELNRAWLIGYATKADLKKCPTGNRYTDSENCPWHRFSYYMAFEKLKPMSEFVRRAGISEIPSGILVERLPYNDDVPVQAKIRMDLMDSTPMDGQWGNDLLGLPDEKPKEPAKAQPDPTADPIAVEEKAQPPKAATQAAAPAQEEFPF